MSGVRECPQCGVLGVGFTPEDWWRHFDEDCNYIGCLYNFAERPTQPTTDDICSCDNPEIHEDTLYEDIPGEDRVLVHCSNCGWVEWLDELEGQA